MFRCEGRVFQRTLGLFDSKWVRCLRVRNLIICFDYSTSYMFCSSTKCVETLVLCSIFRGLGHHYRFGVWCVVLCSASFLFCVLIVDVVAVFGQTRCRCRTAHVNSHIFSRNQRASRLTRTLQHLKELKLQARNTRCRFSKCLTPS